MPTTPTLWLDPRQANSIDDGPSGNGQTNSRVIALTGGRFLVIWEDDTNTFAGGLGANDIAGRIFDAEGNPVGDDFTVSFIYQDGNQTLPDVTALANGGFAVAYQTEDAAGLGDGLNIAVEVYDANAAYVRYEDYREFAPGTDQTAPAITGLDDGGYMLSWVDGDAVTVFTVGADGVKTGFQTAFTPDEGSTADAVDLTTLANGDVVAVARIQGPDAGDNGIAFQVISGETVINSGRIETVAGVEAPTVTGLTGGDFVLSWSVGGDLGLARVHNGVMTVLTGVTAGDAHDATLTALSDGGFVLGWEDGGVIRGQRYDAVGAVVGSVFSTSVPGTESSPTFALLDDGRIAVSFTSITAGNADIRIAIWDPRVGTVSGTNGDDVLTSMLTGGEVQGLGGADRLIGQGGVDVLKGGAGADLLSGRNGDDVLNGGLGADYLSGGSGVDTASYADATAAVLVDLTTPAGNTGEAAGDTYNSIENLIGGGSADTLRGTSGANRLDGGAGADRLEGRAGSDTYVVDNAGDIVVEAAGQGTDLVLSSVTFNASAVLAVGVENVTLTGSSAINALGNALDNVLTGNAGNNGLNGGAGADRMIGGAGNDTYTVDNAGDVVVETGAGNGTADLVRSSVTFDGSTAFVVALENITLTGSAAINAVGNALGNILTGNDANNGLNGGSGADRLIGGLGNDTYTVDNAGDVLVEAAGAGTDMVRSTIGWTLADNLENLTLIGTVGVAGIGNAVANVITGNAGNNILAGKGGADTLTGGAGSDVFDYNAITESSYSVYDRITDLTNADLIDLSGIDANTGVAGNQSFSLVGAFTSHAGEMTLKYDSTKGFTVLSADVNGDGVADMRIVINGDHHDFTNFVF